MVFPSIHILEEKYLEDYEEVEIIPLDQETEEDQMMALIGAKRTEQYYKVFPNKHIRGFES